MEICKFDKMEYQRPDVEKLLAEYKTLTQRAQNAGSGEELLEVFVQHSKLSNVFSTAACLAQIRHTLDTNDAFYDTENDFFDANSPSVENAQLELYRAFLASEHKGALTEVYGEILLQKMEVAAASASDELLELMQEENALASQYQKLYATAQVEFDGKLCTLPQLARYKQSMDAKVRRAAFEADGRFFDEHQQELDDIYTRMIANRNAQAQKLGFENYIPLSYLRMGRLGYNEEDVKRFREQVARYVTPLAHKAMKAQFERIGIPEAKFSDTTISFADGNPLPKGTAQELLDKAVQMYKEMRPETSEFIQFMTESELFDLESRPGKAPGGYCETIVGYGAPFVFSNFNGTAGDVDVLTHEAGHAFQAYVVAQKGMCQELASPGLESCEIHSMSMEFLTSPWHHLFFGEDTAKYSVSHAQEALTFLPYGCMVDEFQHIVYSKPELTAQERNQVWLELEKKYRPWNEFDSIPCYSRGAGWQRQLHIYQYPFYYIDYCLAQMVALQFFAAHLNDAEDAWKRYVALVEKGGSDTYAGLVQAAGFAVPFEEGSIEPVAQQVYDWTMEQCKKL